MLASHQDPITGPQLEETTMTEAQVPDLTPPGKNKKVKAEKATRDPNAPKKERAARKSYGYHEKAIITLVEGADTSYRQGNRNAWYAKIKEFNGRTAGEFLEAHKNEKDPPRGWLRFFVQDGVVTLSQPN